jgi:hypothetical protein
MNTRLDDPTTTNDPVLRAILVVTAAITIVGVLALIRAAVGDGVDHVTVRVDNQAGLAVRVDALDASGDRVGLGEAKPGTFHLPGDPRYRFALDAGCRLRRSGGPSRDPGQDHAGRRHLDDRDSCRRDPPAGAGRIPVTKGGRDVVVPSWRA